MKTDIKLGYTARQAMLNGITKLSDSVTATLGPNGRNVIIERENSNPVSTKDGVTVAKSIHLKDKYENIGAQIIKQAAIKTADVAGDGTTTSTLLAKTLYEKAVEVLSQEKRNAVEIKRGIDGAVRQVVNFLRDKSVNVSKEAELEQVATVSANNDSEVGKIIVTAMDKVGRDGVITVEESKTGETYLETVEGMQFNRGFKSPYFVTDTANMTVTLNDPYILITDKRLTSIKELLPVLETVSSENKPLLIIADDVDGEALSTLVVNKVRGVLNVAAVRAPEFGDRKKMALEDIATLTGGEVISSEKGMRLDKVAFAWLGRARKVTVDKDNTTIIDGKGSEDAINQRVNEIKIQIDNSSSPFEKEQLQERLGRLVGGVAIIHVGGQTEIEMKERKDRIEDALHATRAALDEGILPGGGVALLRASNYLTSDFVNVNSTSETPLNVDQIKGYEIVAEAIKMPFIKIMANAGASDLDILTRTLKLFDNSLWWSGYDPRQEDYVNLLDAGILDPTKVTRLALENAASVAGTLLTTECVVSLVEEENTKQENLMEY